jgi:hypothetical protein
MIKKLLIILFPAMAFGQGAGNIVYATDQVVTVNLTFNQVSFWDSLVANYSSETDMIAAVMEITDNTGVHTLDSINIRLKGNSSYGHPGNKKSFKVDFDDYVNGQTYDGMKKLNFDNGFKDPTFMRAKLFMDISRAAGVPAPRINYANVYMNGTFWGFYTMVEQVDKEFVQNNFADDIGNLFKAGDASGPNPVFADLKYYGALQGSYTGRYELKLNDIVNDWTDLIDLIEFINNTTDTDFENNFASFLNKTPYLRSVATDVLFSNLDSYQNSARNYYVYHDSLNNRWEWVKWDGNEAFGTYNPGGSISNMVQMAPNYVGPNRPLVSRMFANSNLYNEYLLEMCWIMDQFFNSTYFDAKADALKTLIAPHVYADINKMYTDTEFDQNIETNITVSGMGGGTMYGLKSFVAARNTYLHSIVDCTASVDENALSTVSVSPNPFKESFEIKNESGSIESIHLYDLTGKEISFTMHESESSVNIIPVCSSGIYILKLEQDKVQRSYRIIKE